MLAPNCQPFIAALNVGLNPVRWRAPMALEYGTAATHHLTGFSEENKRNERMAIE
jgi:hypothetical protein